LESFSVIATEAYVAGPPAVGTWVISVTPTFSGNTNSFFLCIAVSQPLNAGRNRVKTQFLTFSNSAVSGTPIVITTPYTAKYGKDIDCVGKKIFVDCWFMNPLGTPTNMPKMSNSETITV
jgi:hypothetical protein